MEQNNDPSGMIDLSKLYRFGPFPMVLREQPPREGARVRGIGINDAPYNVSGSYSREYCQAFKVWRTMLTRASKYNLSVDPKWIHFMDFREWLSRQCWRNANLECGFMESQGYDLSPDNAVMVPLTRHRQLSIVNEWRVNPASRYKDDGLPVGVFYMVKDNRYYSSIRDLNTGKQRSLGYYDRVEDAKEAYDISLLDKLEVIQQSLPVDNRRLRKVMEDLFLAV